MPGVKIGAKDASKLINAQDRKENLKPNGTPAKTTEKEKVEPEEKIIEKTAEAPVEKRSMQAGAERMGNLRNKFESGKLGEKKVKKIAPKIKYAGAESAKTKFMEEATKTTAVANGPRGQKEFTPPPEGVAVGVLESKPQPRAPDIVTADDTLDPVDLTMIGETTKNLKEKFKNLEKSGGKLNGEDEVRKSSFAEDFKVEITQNARAKWKDIESGKGTSVDIAERPKIDIRGDGYGGVFENQPEKFENIARAGEESRDLPSGMSARERREQFLKNASESIAGKKDSTLILDINTTESGIYENEPTRRDDVIRYDDEQTTDYPPTAAKWASEAKNRFMQEASKASEKVERGKVTMVDDENTNGEQQNSKEYRFATQAKQAFLDRQRLAEESDRTKARPEIIDIWSEQCAHSGVFESTPSAHTADVVVGYSSEEEEGEE